MVKPSVSSVAVVAISIAAVLLAQSGTGRPENKQNEWATYGHDPGGMRFSPLTQITPSNVTRLEVAWTYHMKPAASDAAAAPAGRGRGGSGFSGSNVTPLVVNGTMYLSTPYSRVVAVD